MHSSLNQYFCSLPPHLLDQVPQYDPELEQSRKCMSEELTLDGNRILAYLPGAVLLHREPPSSGPSAEVGPGRVTKAVLHSVYEIIQDIVRGTSWDDFLELRSQVWAVGNGGPLGAQL